MKKRCNNAYNPAASERHLVNGMVTTTKVVAGAAVAVGALGLLGSLFGKK